MPLVQPVTLRFSIVAKYRQFANFIPVIRTLLSRLVCVVGVKSVSRPLLATIIEMLESCM